MTAYYVASWSKWFVVRCPSRRVARLEAEREFGRNGIAELREATEDEIRAYRVQHGAEAETIED